MASNIYVERFIKRVEGSREGLGLKGEHGYPRKELYPLAPAREPHAIYARPNALTRAPAARFSFQNRLSKTSGPEDQSSRRS